MNSYHVLELVGEGSFGRVHKGRKKGTGQVVALKFMPKVSKKELRNLKREIEIMRRLQHPNIVQLLDSFETQTEVVVVTEYAEGQLFRILEDDGKLPENQNREIACQLVSALYYLHSHRIIHRDMKPQNILLGKSGIVKLCDFGFARAMSVATLVLTSIKGTPLYMSPELVEEKPYDHTADLWSLGCILYEIHTGAPPFYTNSIFHLVKLIVQARVKWPDTMSSTFVDFLKGLLTKEPEKRLNWPDLLHHPFVADGVLVLPDSGVFSPLTVAPSPDLQEQKLKQFAEKFVPTSGQSRLLRKVMQQKDGRRNQRKPMGSNGDTKNNNSSENERPNSGTVAPSGRQEDPDDVSVHPGHTANEMFTSLVQDCTRSHTRKDCEERFSKVEMKSQILGRHSEDSPTTLHKQDYDEEHRMNLSEASDTKKKQNQAMNHSDIVSHLEPKILEFKAQLTSGCVTDVQIHNALKVLRELMMTTSPETTEYMVQKLGLPHVILDLIHIALENSNFFKQLWFVPVLEEMMTVLIIYLERHKDWVEDEQGLEDLCQPFSLILTDPVLRPLSPLAARVLSLFTKCGLDYEVDMENLTSLLNALVTDLCKLKTSLPADWGLCDGLLSLLLYTITEQDNFSVPSSLSPALLLSLWKKIGTSRTTTKLNFDFCSLNGIYSFLSIVLHAFTMDPYSCLLFVTDDESKCVSTLGWLVGTDCLDLFASPVTSEVHRLHHNLSTLSCHLLCFPFALDLPPRTMSTVLQVYDSCGIVIHLLQVILTSMYSMLELPLALLCRLLLCDPEHSFHHLRKAAFSFFSPPSDSQLTASTCQTPTRSASSLLADLLQLDSQWDSAVELLNVLSHVARCSSSSACFQLYVEATVLHQALSHSYDLIRAATCRLLGYLNPFRPPLFILQVDIFRGLIQCLHDSYMPARRTACRSIVNWLGYIAAGCKVDQPDGRCSEPTGKEHNVEGSQTAESAQVTIKARLRVDTDKERTWMKEVKETVPVLTCLITDSDVLMRRHCCAALGNLADIDGATHLLLDHDVPSVLLRAACADSDDAVRKAATATLCLYTQHDALHEALLSLDAKKKLQASQTASSQCQYQQLVGLL